MRITEDLLLPEATGPWGQIAKRAARSYTKTTGKPFDGLWFDDVALSLHGSAYASDPVAWGFARKAVRQMQHTCPMCGSPARTRSHLGRTTTRCCACHLPEAFLRELEHFQHASVEPSGQPRAVWAEHELPTLIRSAIPSHAWRQMPLEHGGQQRFLTGADLDALQPWLNKLAVVMYADSNARIERLTKATKA